MRPRGGDRRPGGLRDDAGAKAREGVADEIDKLTVLQVDPPPRARSGADRTDLSSLKQTCPSFHPDERIKCGW
jgi:hypothetical protein